MTKTSDQYAGNHLAQTVARYARTFSATRRHIVNPDSPDATLCGGRIRMSEIYTGDNGRTKVAAPWMIYTQIPCERCERSAAKRGIVPDSRERDVEAAHAAALAEDAERTPAKSDPPKATSIHQPIGTMHGHRAIVFHFTTKDGRHYSAPVDFYGAGARFNGMEYRHIEAAALRGAVEAGLDVVDYSHVIVANH